MSEYEHEKQRLGERIRQERERLGMSQEEFGELAGTNRVTQAQYEKGIREPKHSYFKALEVHGVDIPFLVLGKSGVGQMLGNAEFLEAEKTAFRLLAETIQTHQIKIDTLSPEALHLAFVGFRDQVLRRSTVNSEGAKRRRA